MSSVNNNRRIAKNTFMLYMRICFTMLLSLYTSRLILSYLGVQDFGIYNVVGGVVAIFSFLNSSMSGATSRFISYDLGLGDFVKLKKTFCATFTIHLYICLILFIVAETIGLWIINSYLNIPSYRMFAANVVYQISIFTACLTVLQVPFKACIISHEDMDIFAYIEMLNAVLKLLAVLLLAFGSADKLIMYTAFLLIAQFIISSIYFIFSYRKYAEVALHIVHDFFILKPILTFSGWDLYGYMGVVCKTQGTNIILNSFIGPLINAANGITLQVQGALLLLSSNLVIAIRPQVVKHYANHNYESVKTLLYTSATFVCLLFSCLAIPLIIEMPFILKLWLGIIPDYTIDFCRLSLVAGSIQSISYVLNCGIHATGKMKAYSIITGSMYFLLTLVSYLCLYFGCSPEIVYANEVVLVIIMMFTTLYLLKRYISVINMWDFSKKVILSSGFVLLLSTLLSLTVYLNVQAGFLRFVFLMLAMIISVVILSYRIILTKEQRSAVKSLIYGKIVKTKNK